MNNVIDMNRYRQMATPVQQDTWPKRVYRQRKRADLLETITTITSILFALGCVWLGAVLVMSLGG